MPTPAPDYPTLYNVEDPFEDACAAIWDARSYGIPASVSRECGDLPATRIDIKLEVGTNFNEHDYAWTGQLVITCWTRRDTGSRSANGALRGKVRDCFRKVPTSVKAHPEFTEAILPLHVVNRMSATGADPQSWDEVDQLDRSRLFFDVLISVRPGCFPVAP